MEGDKDLSHCRSDKELWLPFPLHRFAATTAAAAADGGGMERQVPLIIVNEGKNSTICLPPVLFSGKATLSREYVNSD